MHRRSSMLDTGCVGWPPHGDLKAPKSRVGAERQHPMTGSRTASRVDLASGVGATPTRTAVRGRLDFDRPMSVCDSRAS